MTKKTSLQYIITNVAIFIPAPPYVGYGITLLIAFNIIFSICLIYSFYIRTLETKFRIPLLLTCAGTLAVLVHLALTFFSPVIALTLGFVLYLIPLTVLTFDQLYPDVENIKEKRNESFKTLAYLSIVVFLFFVIREFFAFGSISYPTQDGIAIIQFPVNIFPSFSFFWSSIPGALIILALFMLLIPFILNFNDEGKQEEEK